MFSFLKYVVGALVLLALGFFTFRSIQSFVLGIRERVKKKSSDEGKGQGAVPSDASEKEVDQK